MTRVIRRWQITASSLAAVVIAACRSGHGEGSAAGSSTGFLRGFCTP